MRDDPACGACGHRQSDHLPVLIQRSGREGDLSTFGFYGRCSHPRSVTMGGSVECSCPRYAVERLPRLTELIGFEARRVVA